MFCLAIALDAGTPPPPIVRNALPVETVGGWRVADGDMIVNREASLGARLWPGGRIPYEVAPNFRMRECLDAAIREWNTRTPIRLAPRAGEPDYAVFTPATRSFTSVGLVGGSQPVFLAEGDCQYGMYRVMVHEIGHTVGLFHEHQRSDRDRYIRVIPENFFLAPVTQDLVSVLGAPLGPYDYASVMHYGLLGGSASGAPALETIPKGIPTGLDVGMANMLSAGDIDAVQRRYGEEPRLTTITTHPPGLDVVVDGQLRATPFNVDWAAGSQHTLDVPSPQAREGARFEFARWNDDGRQNHTVTAGGLTQLTANFSTYVRVRGLANDPARGTVALDSPTGEPAPADGLRIIGTPVRLRAQGAPGFFLLNWESARGSRNPLVFPVFHPDAAISDFVARFEPYPTTTITSQPAGLRVQVNGAFLVTPVQVRWEPGTLQSVEFAREIVAGEARYRAEVFRTETPIQDGRLLATPYDATITAIYRTEYRVRLASTPAGAGEVTTSPALPDGFALSADRLQLTARANAGFRFVRWRGAANATGVAEENPLNAAVTGPMDLVAEFAPLQSGPAGQVSVRNAASALAGPIAPGAIISLFVEGGGLPELAFGGFTDSRLATELAGVRVLMNGSAIPLIAVAPGQVNAIASYSLAPRSRARIEIQRDGRPIGEAVTAEVAEAAPALFTANSSGSGPAAALNQDSSYNSASLPASPGDVVVLFGTGDGLLDPAPAVDGMVAAAPLARPRLPITVDIGGRAARVLYAGPAPGAVLGLLQINAEVPAGAAPGAATVIVKAGELRSAPGVTIAIK